MYRFREWPREGTGFVYNRENKLFTPRRHRSWEDIAMRRPLRTAGSSCILDENGGGKAETLKRAISNNHPEKVEWTRDRQSNICPTKLRAHVKLVVTSLK